MRKYEVIIFWSAEDKIFVAEVPQPAGCMAHGRTQTEALQNVNDAIELRIETAREFGDEIPAPLKHKLAA